MSRLYILTILFISVLISSCSTNNSTESLDTKYYVGISKRDTVHLRIQQLNKRFFGTMIYNRPGNVVDSGSVEGNVAGDSLVGDFSYTPYRHQHTKRKPLVLLLKDGKYLMGSGKEVVYMGISSYVPETISFEDPKFILEPSTK